MALKGTTIPSTEGIKVLETISKFNMDLGKNIKWQLMLAPINSIKLNQFNNRFAPDEALTDEEHEDAIIKEDSIAFDNLQKSWENNPQFEQLIGINKSNPSDPKGSMLIDLIGGHRRYFAAKRAKAMFILIWVAMDELTADEIEHIRDWPEIHQTKVVHSSFAKSKAIYNDLKGRTEIDREKRIKIWQQKGYTKSQILKAEKVFGRLDTFCKSIGEKAQDRAGQMKSFETYNQICDTTFEELKDQGEIQRIITLDKVARAFLKEQIAHDDLKVAVDGLAKLPATDPVYKAINEDPNYLNDVENLRRLTNLGRAERNNRDLVDETKDFTGRVFAKLIDRAQVDEIKACMEELRDTANRLQSALENLTVGGDV